MRNDYHRVYSRYGAYVVEKVSGSLQGENDIFFISNGVGTKKWVG